MENKLVGAWQAVTDKPCDLPEDVASGFQECMGSMRGAQYMPIAYVAKRLTHGVDHMLISRQTLAVEGEQEHLVKVVLNQSLDDGTVEGQWSVVSIEDMLGAPLAPSNDTLDEEALNAYAQWVAFDIIVDGSFVVVIENAHCKHGKFHKFKNKDREMSPEEVDGLQIRDISPESSRTISACGRSDAAVGTEGSFDIFLFDQAKGGPSAKIAVVKWDCPWWKKSNSFSVKKVNDDFTVTQTGGNWDSGAIGNITITIKKGL